MSLRSSVVMSRSTYAVTWVAEQIGDQPEALFVLPDTATPERLAASTRRAAEELGALGLFDPRSGVHLDLLAVFRLLARPELEFYGTVAHQHHPEPFSVLAAAAGGSAVLAVLDEARLALHPVPTAGLAEAVVGVLPGTPSAQGQSVTVPASAVDGPSVRYAAAEEGISVFGGQTPADMAVTRLRRLAAEPRLGGAQLYVAMRDRLGRRRRAPFPLNIIDLPAGRWFLQRQPNSGGEVWLTAAPATPHTVVVKLNEMCHGLTA